MFLNMRSVFLPLTIFSAFLIAWRELMTREVYRKKTNMVFLKFIQNSCCFRPPPSRPVCHTWVYVLYLIFFNKTDINSYVFWIANSVALCYVNYNRISTKRTWYKMTELNRNGIDQTAAIYALKNSIKFQAKTIIKESL